MVRKGFWCGLSFMTGLFLANCFDISFWWIFALCFAALAAIGAFVFSKHRRYFCVCGLCVVIGLSYSAAYTYLVYDDIISADGEIVTVDGKVSDYSYIGHGQGYLTVKGDIKGHTTTVSFLVSDDDYGYYDDVRVTGKVTQIKDNYNFESKRYYFGQGVFLKGDGAASAEILQSHPDHILRLIRDYSDHTFSTLSAYAGDDEKGFLCAMLCGDKSEMNASQKNMLYRSGIGHIFAVSGTHLVMLISVAGYFIKHIIRRKRASAVIMLCLVWAFAVFAGMSVPIVRSAVMMSIVYAGQLFLRRADSANSLGIAGLILCISNPYCVFSQSFLMSFFSAFAAGVTAPFIYERLNIDIKRKPLLKPVIFSTVVSLTAAPVSLILFGGFSALAPLTNILLIPLCTAALVLCFMVPLTGCVPFIAKPLLWSASLLIKLVLSAVRLISEFTLSYITAGSTAAAVLILIFVFAALVFVCISKSPKRSAAALALGTAGCVFVSCISTLMGYSKIDFYVFANKATCTVAAVQSDKALVLDLGTKGSYIRAVQRLIESKGVRTVDAVFVERETYYTVSRYSSSLYPQPTAYLSGGEVIVEQQDCYELSDGSVTHLGDITVTRINNGFEIEFKGEKYTFCTDSFSVGNSTYKTQGVSSAFSTDDKTVRRLDYELSNTGYTW